MLFDSHSHLDMKDFEEDREELLLRARDNGITHILSVGIDVESSFKALDLAREHDFIYSSVGFHPHNADDIESGGLDELEGMSSDPKVVAWGEIGLDFFRRYSRPENQIKLFKRQLDMASNLHLPVIIHDRDSQGEVLKILRERGSKSYGGVIHCFSGDYGLATDFLELDYYISIPGIVTYKNAVNVRDVASRIPLDRMLIETDAPFLAPVPERGKRNEPFFITYTAREIARLRDIDFKEVALRTSENAKRLFGIQL